MHSGNLSAEYGEHNKKSCTRIKISITTKKDKQQYHDEAN